ncbi:hypothetical protein CR513_31618, partial [Mucuna pruriens]
MDVKNTFFKWIYSRRYVEQSLGFENFELANHLFILKRTICSLKQAFKAWYNRVNKFLFEKWEFSNFMTSVFEMSMIGELMFFLGIQIKQLEGGTFTSQSN